MTTRSLFLPALAATKRGSRLFSLYRDVLLVPAPADNGDQTGALDVTYASHAESTLDKGQSMMIRGGTDSSPHDT